MIENAQSRVLYADCFSGVSGDMLLGALMHLGAPATLFQEIMALLRIDNCTVTVAEHRIGSLTGMKVTITKQVGRSCAIPGACDTPSGGETERTLGTITDHLGNSDLPATVKSKSLAVFQTLAKAEAAIHGCSPEEVHFHEIGGEDALIDIVGTIWAMESLGVTQVLCSPLPMPRGWVHCRHGLLPVPAPAVCSLLEGVPVYGVAGEEELVTPTGAALLKTLCAEFGPMPPMILEKTGYGAGDREWNDDRPNLLRLMLGTTHQPRESQEIEVIETHIDDMPPELYPYIFDRLFALGALDVSLVPIQMKKGRPGFLLRVLADPAMSLTVKECILGETTAIGLRYHREHRMTLARAEQSIQTRWGEMKVKMVQTPRGVVYYPEHEECRRLANLAGVPLLTVYNEVYARQPARQDTIRNIEVSVGAGLKPAPTSLDDDQGQSVDR